MSGLLIKQIYAEFQLNNFYHLKCCEAGGEGGEGVVRRVSDISLSLLEEGESLVFSDF